MNIPDLTWVHDVDGLIFEVAGQSALRIESKNRTRPKRFHSGRG